MTTLFTLGSVAADRNTLRVPSRAGTSKSSLLFTRKVNGDATWTIAVTFLTAAANAFGATISGTVMNSRLSDLGSEAALD